MIFIQAPSFGEAHWRVLSDLFQAGRSIPTDYDVEDEEPSLDAPVAIEITSPWSPPIFSRCMFSDAKGAFDYVEEVVSGSHDHLIDMLGYTYHDRLHRQWDGQLAELQRNPQTRRAQSITWRPDEDTGSPHPPCLQRIWTRIVDGRLEMHTHWRSRDAYKAWGLNVFALAHLHKQWAERLSVEPGIYREFIDSFHVYGRDIAAAEKALRRGQEAWQWSYEDIIAAAY
jgi:thymidylate synthase